MGLIKAGFGAIGGTLADAWLDAFTAGDMDDKTVFVKGAVLRADKRSSNTKGTSNIVSNGSKITVYDNQFMILTDGGAIVDYTAEPGYYTVDNKAQPSLFNGEFKDSLSDAWNRFKFGGTPGQNQQVFFLNLQEVKGIKFGTKAPVQYFDNFYNAELFIRCFGNYSIKLTNPLLFYKEAVPRNAERTQIDDINDQYLSEFLTALQAAINNMSADGIRVSFLAGRSTELADYMSKILDKSWNEMRGMIVQSVGVESISYDDKSQELINMRNQGAMLGDPNIREGYVQGAVAHGIEQAGANPAGAGAAMMGVGFGMNAGGGFMGSASASNQAQMQRQEVPSSNAADTWTCACGMKNIGKFCSDCGAPKPEEWACACGAKNTGKFCVACGAGKPEAWICACGAKNVGKFCANCGAAKP